MPTVDFAKLARPLSSDSPAGKDMRQSPDFYALERSIESRPAETDEEGKILRAAMEPDWRVVRDNALAMLNQTRDLDIASILTLAELKVDGLPGFAGGLSVLAAYVSPELWSVIFPVADEGDTPDDQYRPRTNALENFATPMGQMRDQWRIVERLMEVPIADSGQWGKYGLLHMEIAAGRIRMQLPDGKAPDQAVIMAAMTSTDPAKLQAVEKLAGECLASLDAIEQGVAAAGVSPPDFGHLRRVLGDIRKQAQVALEQQGGGDAAAQADGESQAGSDAGAASSGGSSASAPGGSAGLRLGGGDVTASRREAKQAIEKICAYFEKYEPSSPVPLVLKGAMRLIGRPFYEIYDILPPDKVQMLRQVAETPENSES